MMDVLFSSDRPSHYADWSARLLHFHCLGEEASIYKQTFKLVQESCSYNQLRVIVIC